MGLHYAPGKVLEEEDRQGGILKILSGISSSEWLNLLVFEEDVANGPGADFASATYYRYPPTSA